MLQLLRKTKTVLKKVKKFYIFQNIQMNPKKILDYNVNQYIKKVK